MLLCALLRAAGAFVELSRRGPSTPRMARALLQAVLAVRYHREASVRLAAQWAVSRVALAASVQPDAVLSAAQDELAEAAAWLADASEADPNPGCRRGASVLSAAVGGWARGGCLFG
jgi:hypothetical protein